MQECRLCGSTHILQKPRPDTIHYAEWRCGDCNYHLGWVPKPRPEEPTLPEDLFEAITACTVELKRTGYTWKSDRVVTFSHR